MKYDIILNTTTFCNYNCSYCDVIKSKKNISKQNQDNILDFLKNNYENINTFKFFWWEPLLAFDVIKNIIDNSISYLWSNFIIVTNTSILNDEIWDYFKKYFKQIFFSIDSENLFDYKKVQNFIDKYDLKDKIYFNLVINPWEEKESYNQFKKLYKLWYKNFNILPIYFTKTWSKQDLEYLWEIMKNILNISIKDNSLELYWFQENHWDNSSLINKSFFIDVDWLMYYSDIISNFFWENLKNLLFLWKIEKIFLKDFFDKDFSKQQKIISNTLENIYNNVIGQKQLNKMINYFSIYLNSKNGK